MFIHAASFRSVTCSFISFSHAQLDSLICRQSSPGDTDAGRRRILQRARKPPCLYAMTAGIKSYSSQNQVKQSCRTVFLVLKCYVSTCVCSKALSSEAPSICPHSIFADQASGMNLIHVNVESLYRNIAALQEGLFPYHGGDCSSLF